MTRYEKTSHSHVLNKRNRDSNMLAQWVGPLEKDTLLIHVGKGRFTKVDTEDFENLSKWVWTSKKEGYSYRIYKNQDGKRKSVIMHRLLMGVENDSRWKQVDHKNRDPLDNRKSNLRICDLRHNLANAPKKSSANEFKGITKHGKKWAAQITVNRKNIYLGAFRNPNEAAIAYNNAAVIHYGEFALLNNVINQP